MILCPLSYFVGLCGCYVLGCVAARGVSWTGVSM